MKKRNKKAESEGIIKTASNNIIELQNDIGFIIYND